MCLITKYRLYIIIVPLGISNVIQNSTYDMKFEPITINLIWQQMVSMLSRNNCTIFICIEIMNFFFKVKILLLVLRF